MTAVRIESLDHEGHGISRVDGKVTFVDGALPGEIAEISVFRKHPKYDSANAVRILKSSSQRASPKCAHYGRCGGCVLQHLEVSAQVAAKQRILEESLQRIGKIRPEIILPALYGPAWGYRHRARFSVKRVDKKGGALVGFHEKKSWFIADMHSCEVLPPHVASLFMPMRQLIPQLSNSDRIPQIELAIGETSTVLVFRLLTPWNEADKEIVRAFADRHGVEIWVQPKGPDTAEPFHPENAALLQYSLPEFNVVHPFRPTEFTQVNPHINRALVHRALALLAPQPHERIADFFCGLGNFTLPIARSGARVVGIEGSKNLAARAQENARLNGIGNVEYAVDNLFEMTPEKYAALGGFDKLLIDPPRDGAMELVKSLPVDGPPQRIVYISCNPSTLARDAEVLCHVKGYALKAAGVANMFPHTAHVESIALFERHAAQAD
ncbi:23S rRNA (uracil(1939)-C(5))-methyltransferase RlmD [Betaproteobacteria bacterium SCN2]|nr:23S rRNA (uracil(1939)-C(5))-methyltransferase RlmD [Betaproteobacteria bacterium SCN2]